MKYIKVRFAEEEDVGKIILKENKIKVEANNKRTKEFLKELVNKWRKREKLSDKKLFEIIPGITSYYSRLFFSNVIEED